MDKEFVPYAEALALKELGYRDPCFGLWWFNQSIHKANEEQLEIRETYYFQLFEYCLLAPTFSQAFRFFREKYKLHHRIDVEDTKLDLYYYEILEVKKGQELYISEVYEGINFKSYEEAELACLRKLIEIVKGGK